MLAAGLRTFCAFLLLLFGLFSAALARSQDLSSLAREIPVRPRAVLWVEKCTPQPAKTHFVTQRARDSELGPFPSSLAEDDAAAPGIDESCAASRLAWTDLPGFVVKPHTPCSTSAHAPHESPCVSSADQLSGQLDSFGKRGADIRRAREETLEILRSPNACSQWFASKDPAVDLTFQSLGFLIDQQGPSDVQAAFAGKLGLTIRQPYVASATQDGGAHTDITINANGAFYRKLAKLQKISVEGGPDQPAGQQWLTVGVYTGDTLQAQILTLLHELGHIIDLLPEDADDLDGRSAKNTGEVLRHCRPAIEALVKPNRESAKR
jgi:hypothetical protein